MANTTNDGALDLNSSLVTRNNVRYLTISNKTVNKTVVGIKFRIFAASEAVLNAVVTRLKSDKNVPTGAEGKLESPKYNGWDLKENLFFKEFIAPSRPIWQDDFKRAKNAAIAASTAAIFLNVLEAVKEDEKPEEKPEEKALVKTDEKKDEKTPAKDEKTPAKDGKSPKKVVKTAKK